MNGFEEADELSKANKALLVCIQARWWYVRFGSTAVIQPIWRERPVWMAPALQGLFDGLTIGSGAVLCPAC
jgi:hypothetical protein